jgi:hypothetical protein
MTMRWLSTWILLLGLALPAHAGDDPAVARLALFLDTHGHQSGLPDEPTSAAMRPLVSAGLDADIAVARMAVADFVRDHPDEKPPFVDGPLFNSSGYEPYTAYAIVADPAHAGHPGADGERRTLVVRYTDDTVTPAATWEDAYAFVHEDGTWRLDDVAFRGGFATGNAGTLRAALRGEPPPADTGIEGRIDADTASEPDPAAPEPPG